MNVWTSCPGSGVEVRAEDIPWPFRSPGSAVAPCPECGRVNVLNRFHACRGRDRFYVPDHDRVAVG